MAYSEQVEKLLRSAAQALGQKDYETAVDMFGQACGLNQEETGEMDPDLFLLYGKALYESGVSKSDVLGGEQITNEKIEESKSSVAGEEDEKDGNFQFNSLAADIEEDEDEDEGEVAEDDGEEEEGDEGERAEGASEEEEKSDLELAWDILEVSRGLFEKRLEDNHHLKVGLTIPYLESDKQEPSNQFVKTLKSLSEVYDLLGEVSLESEHFQQAANDLEKCLDMRTQLYDKSLSPLVGESHFKLSLALEFCLEDEAAKDKARDHIKAAIIILNNDSEKHPNKKTDNDDIVQSLRDRYDEIDGTAEAAIDQQKQALMEGLMGKSSGANLISALSGAGAPGGSAAASQPTVNDLSGMVKKRKPKPKDGNAKRVKQ
ncbi:hypothetical protein PSN45_002308 [Yamadazyma tenuis]|uniref:uncharacterized protein n=1 Tax=Candida tenuis TaxID=2315449 RepID=UPI00279F3523|nr:hypothetical protein PSN45_002308 [Yamadazyma tenuis]